MQNSSTIRRYDFIDIAKFYGIFLVYYGHFVESLMKAEVPAAAVQYKFIYSFHMPLFFLIAGYVVKEAGLTIGAVKYIYKKVENRLVPFLFFTGLLILPTFFFSGHHGPLDLTGWQGYLTGLKVTIFLGLPVFNLPTWFLVCLFSVEILHLLLGRLLDTTIKLLVVMVVCYLFCAWLNHNFDIYNPIKGKFFPYFYTQEAIGMYGFYLFGVFLRRGEFLGEKNRILPEGAATVLSVVSTIALFLVVVFTYDLNRGSFTYHVYDAVVAMFSSHGHVFWFPLTALAGSLMILCLAKATPKIGFFSYLGRNTLVLFCLNGLFYHFVNDPLAMGIATKIQSEGMLTFVAVMVTLFSLLVTAAFVPLFNNYLPWCVGRQHLQDRQSRRTV